MEAIATSLGEEEEELLRGRRHETHCSHPALHFLPPAGEEENPGGGDSLST